jgi:hypothetical protein
MPDFLTGLTIVTGIWGLAAGPAGFWLGVRRERQNAFPNIRRQYEFWDGGFDCKITIQARTSEDIIVSSVSAGGKVCVDEPDLVFDDGGSIIAYNRHWRDSPATVEWLIRGGETQTFSVMVDSASDLSIRLTLSSSARTLTRVAAIIQPPANP